MQQTNTTNHLTMPAIPRPRFAGLPLPMTITICTFCLIAIAALAGRIASAPAAIAVPTPSLASIIVIATAQPVAVPVVAQQPAQQVAAAPAGNVTRRAIVAYGSPDLASAIGAVEPGRAFTPVAHYGSEWMVVDLDGSGRVYVRVAELYDLPAGLVDLKPAPAAPQPAQPVYVAAPVVEQPYQVTNNDQPAAAPPEQPAPEAQPVVAPVVQQPAPAAAPVPQGAVMPYRQDDVQRELNRQASCSEHPEWNCH